jgi:hypothetical protein
VKKKKKNPQIAHKMGLYIYLGFKNHTAFPQEAHVTPSLN